MLMSAVSPVCRERLLGSWRFPNSPPTHSWRWSNFFWSALPLSTLTLRPSGQKKNILNFFHKTTLMVEVENWKRENWLSFIHFDITERRKKCTGFNKNVVLYQCFLHGTAIKSDRQWTWGVPCHSNSKGLHPGWLCNKTGFSHSLRHLVAVKCTCRHQ